MARRRRHGSPLLPKMIGIGVLVVAALLPLLAYLGAFRAGKTNYLQMTMITQPLPKVPKQEHQAKKPQHQKPHVTAHKAGAKAPVSTKALQVHVAAAATKGPPSDNTIVNGSNTNVGTVPLPTPPPPAPANSGANTTPAAAPPPPPVKAPAPPPPAPTPAPVVTPPPPPAPHVPVVVAAVPISQPQPQIPDDLLSDAINGTCAVLLTIHADGTVDATQQKSCGNSELDQIALDTVKKWRFHPALKDGVPAESYLHVDFDFDVS